MIDHLSSYEHGRRVCGCGMRGPRELRKKTAKRVAPNEPMLLASRRPGKGRGRKDEVQSTKDEKGRSCGTEEVVSGQSSVVSRVFSGDPQGSAGELRNVDFGMRNREQGKVEKSKIKTSKVQIGRRCEPRKSSVAEQSHFAASSTRPARKAGRCLDRRMVGAGMLLILRTAIESGDRSRAWTHRRKFLAR